MVNSGSLIAHSPWGEMGIAKFVKQAQCSKDNKTTWSINQQIEGTAYGYKPD